jgi:hypothetical protein
MIKNLLQAMMVIMATGINTADAKIQMCPDHTVTIENRSSQPVRIKSVRFLEVKDQKWIAKDVGSPVIDAGRSWSGAVSLAGLKTTQTFVDAKYEILQDPQKNTWSDVFGSSEKHVESCKTVTASHLLIVDLRY